MRRPERFVGEGEAVAQHKCGTCRYFEEGGFAGSGRCSHPLRKNIQQMVLVRRSELACRSDWANDLWEPKAGAEPLSIASNPRYTSEAGKADDRRQYTDRVTAVSVAPSRATHEESLPSTPRGRVTTQVDEPRVEQTSTFDAEPEDEPASREDTGARVQSRADHNEDAEERPKFDVRRDLLQSNSSTERAERTMAPDRTSNRNEQDAGRDVAATPPKRDDFDSRSWALPRNDTPPSRPRDAQPERHQPAAQPPQPPARRSFGDEPPGRFGAPPTSLPETRPVDTDRQRRTPAAEKPASDALPQGRSGWTEPFSVAAPASSPVAHPPVRAEALPVVDDEPHPVKSVPAPPVNPPVSARQSPMKECCATCRDFRPAEGGQRGWCNNPYAFDHRQMVEKNDLACRSTIGSWWIASDDWWMQRADITHHGRPTPIVDDLLRQLLNWRAQRRAVRG